MIRTDTISLIATLLFCASSDTKNFACTSRCQGANAKPCATRQTNADCRQFSVARYQPRLQPPSPARVCSKPTLLHILPNKHTLAASQTCGYTPPCLDSLAHHSTDASRRYVNKSDHMDTRTCTLDPRHSIPFATPPHRHTDTPPHRQMLDMQRKIPTSDSMCRPLFR